MIDEARLTDKQREYLLAFHLGRRMFIIQEGTLMWGPENSPLSHTQWITQDFDAFTANHVLATCVRGYVNTTGVYLYKGPKFNIDTEVIKEAWKRGRYLVEHTRAPNLETVHVYVGVIPRGVPGQWPPLISLGRPFSREFAQRIQLTYLGEGG